MKNIYYKPNWTAKFEFCRRWSNLLHIRIQWRKARKLHGKKKKGLLNTVIFVTPHMVEPGGPKRSKNLGRKEGLPLTLTVRDNTFIQWSYSKIIFDQSKPTTLNKLTLTTGLNEMGKGHHDVCKAGESVKQFLHHFIPPHLIWVSKAC